MVLDGVIVATSLFVVSWVCVLRNLSGEGSALTVLHIALDIVLMSTAILVWSRPVGRVSVTVLAAGMTTIEMADIASMYLAGRRGISQRRFRRPDRGWRVSACWRSQRCSASTSGPWRSR